MLALRAPGVRAAVDPAAGGRLASLEVGGRELLIGPAVPGDRAITWGCYLMAPWPGRLADARLPWNGGVVQLPRTHGPHAIHGLLWDRAWDVESAHEAQSTLACALPPEWPATGIVRHTCTLTASGITMEASITAGGRMPAALGWHPWFDRRGQPMRLLVDAAEVVETADMIPTGRTLAADGLLDLRAGPELGDRRLDDAFVRASAPAILSWPDLRLTLAFDPSPATVVVYTPEHAVCVEPQTALPNALALPEPAARAAGVRFLEPGETLAARFELSWD